MPLLIHNNLDAWSILLIDIVLLIDPCISSKFLAIFIQWKSPEDYFMFVFICRYLPFFLTIM